MSVKKKFRIDPFRWLFYNFVKTLVLISYRIFYAKETLINGYHLTDVQRPAIIVSNHPSTLMDPMNAAKQVNGIVFFLANAGMFAHWFTNWFFTTFYAIKVERPVDVGGRKIQNEKAFEMCDDFLERRNGVLYIAAEGGSRPVNRLRKLKTGTARIAFNAEKTSDFKLGLTIIPVSITYENLFLFRKEVIIKVAEPIRVADYQKDWEKDNWNAVLKLTDDMAKTMQENLLHTEPEDDDVDELVQKIGTLEQNTNQLSFVAKVEKQKQYIAPLVRLKKEKPSDFAEIQSQANAYFQALATAKISDKAVVKSNSISDYIKLILGFPFFLYGYINNFFAIAIPGWVNKKMDLFNGYYPTVKICVGLLTLPFFYWLQTKLLSPYFPAAYWKWIYLASLIPLGLLAWNYMQVAKRVWKRMRFERMDKEKLDKQRRLLLSNLETKM